MSKLYVYFLRRAGTGDQRSSPYSLVPVGRGLRVWHLFIVLAKRQYHSFVPLLSVLLSQFPQAQKRVCLFISAAVNFVAAVDL